MVKISLCKDKPVIFLQNILPGQQSQSDLTNMNQIGGKPYPFEIIIIDDISYVSYSREETDVLFTLLAEKLISNFKYIIYIMENKRGVNLEINN